ncbi:MAG: hypothetical protein WCK49_07550 [Myxococcaceae bacterium]
MIQDLITTFLEVTQKLEAAEIPYMIVGSVASMTYGEPRMTHDLDLVVQVMPRDAAKFEQIFPSEEYYCPPEEIVKPEILRQGQFNLIHHDTGLKIDIVIRKGSEHAKMEFARRSRVPFWQNSEVFMASPEDVILKKLEYFREGASQKHLRDIQGILAQTQIDETYLQSWISKLGLERQWAEILI